MSFDVSTSVETEFFRQNSVSFPFNSFQTEKVPKVVMKLPILVVKFHKGTGKAPATTPTTNCSQEFG